MSGCVLKGITVYRQVTSNKGDVSTLESIKRNKKSIYSWKEMVIVTEAALFIQQMVSSNFFLKKNKTIFNGGAFSSSLFITYK